MLKERRGEGEKENAPEIRLIILSSSKSNTSSSPSLMYAPPSSLALFFLAIALRFLTPPAAGAAPSLSEAAERSESEP
jgi:hypothetical protein